jgi:hypothetical protein
MDKQEKYINYVVDDLINKTEVDYGKKSFTTPFLQHNVEFNMFSFNTFSLKHSETFGLVFSKYVSNTYGVRGNEIKIVWGKYRTKIQRLIKK